MAWFLTIKELKGLLNKYDDEAVVMLGIDRDSGESYEADNDPTYAYLTPDGELVDEFSIDKNESIRGYRRALVIWSVDK